MPVLDSDKIVTRLRAAFNHGSSRPQLLALAADLIREAGPPYTSVYLYMLDGDELVLEAFSGRETEHTRIAVGHGVCGTAVATGKIRTWVTCAPGRTTSRATSSPGRNWWC